MDGYAVLSHIRHKSLPPIYFFAGTVAAALVVLEVGEHAGVHADMEGVTLVWSERHKRGTHGPTMEVARHVDAGIGKLLGIDVVRERCARFPPFAQAQRSRE